jgi:hypothetical protein
MAEERIEVQRTIEAAPAAVFAVLADPQGHVDIDASGMLMGATGAPVTAVGDEFVVHMDRESLNDFPLGRYDVTVQICTYEQDHEIAWKILGLIRPQIGHIYGYRIESDGAGGSLVTSYYDWTEIDPEWKGKIAFPIVPESSLRNSLGLLARRVQAAPDPATWAERR